MFQRGRLIRESEWMRVYECQYESRKSTLHESKFLTHGLEVSADSIIRRWPRFSIEERYDFTNAFAVKPKLTVEDERLLDFLMQQDDFYVWMTIAALLPAHSNRDRALAFLENRIRDTHPHKANFFQALQVMGDKRALPGLRAAHADYKKVSTTEGGPPREFDFFDYLACCEALWVLDGSKEYKEDIQALVTSGDAATSAEARRILTTT